MAHVCQELALSAARFHRLVARDGQVRVHGGEFGSSGFDCTLESFLALHELDIAAMDLREHLVEAGDEIRDFVLALTLTLDANVVDLVLGHGACHGRETQQWRRDRALHARRKNEGKTERREEDQSDD